MTKPALHPRMLMGNVRLDLFSLRLYVDIVDSCSIAHGAKKNFIAISAASRRMTDLEANFGCRLLHRKHRGVEPTDAGRFLYERLKRALTDLQQLTVEMSEFAKGARGRISVWATPAAAALELPAALADFNQHYPEIAVELLERPAEEIVQAVADGDADIGLLTPAGPYPNDLRHWRYGQLRQVAIMPAAHPLASYTHISMDDLLMGDMVIAEHLDADYRALAAERGGVLNVRARVSGFDAVCRMVAAGAGVALVPEACAQLHARDARLKWRRLHEAWADSSVDICSRGFDAMSVAARCLLNHLRRESAGAPAEGGMRATPVATLSARAA